MDGGSKIKALDQRRAAKRSGDRRRPFYLMFRAGQAVRSAVAHFGHGAGVTLGDYTLLSLIGSQSEMTTTKLARRLQITAQSVNERLAVLTRTGEIDRTPSPRDARAVIFSLTDQGRATKARAEAAIDRAEDYLFEGTPLELQEQVWEFLGLMVERGRLLDTPDAPGA